MSRAVTQTSEDSRPHLKWAARFVTRAAAGTYSGAGLARRCLPRMRLSISTTWKPGFSSGIPTTSKAFPPPGAGRLNSLPAVRPSKRDLSRVAEATLRSQ
ncbi:MAG: hypothetical protein A4E73_01442 [Syntrophaceae bacterium PtaU1.Bin231]|nr:MAG: hypothetical protein A4E73_01442 [Syntrophaceae bacterium PtaU1.Bin231]